VIVMDTVRADHLSLYGYERDTSPNLKALAKDAMVYTHAQSASDMTLTSHASLFSGMYPSWHGAYCKEPEAAYGRPLSNNVPTLAEILKGQGYTTLGVAANLYLRSAFGLDRGFQEFSIKRPVPMLSDENKCQLRRPMRRLLSLVTDTAQFDRLNSSAEDIDDEFFTTLDGRGALDDSRGAPDGPRAPFFGFVNYMDAHFPYIPPAPWDRKFPGKVSTLTKDYLESEQNAISSGGDTPADYRQYCISQYDGGIAYLDAQIGRIVAGLKQRGLYDNTMIVVTSDHGEAFGERHHVEHGNSPYQNLLHVALLVKYPKSAFQGTAEAPVSLIDVAPTVLQVAGVPVPRAMQGRSLLNEPAPLPTGLFAETFQCQVMQSVDCKGCSARAMVAWPFKYIVFNTGKRQLFKLDLDPDETREVSSMATGEMAALGQTMAAWGKTIPVQPVQQMKLSPDEERRLKSLGYVGGRSAAPSAGTPAVAASNPATARLGQTVTFNLTGVNTNFSPGATRVDAGPGVTAGAATVISPTSLRVQLTVAANAPLGARTLVVVTGSERAVLANGFTIQ
jgi:arylsulfatase A-like enzyme